MHPKPGRHDSGFRLDIQGLRGVAVLMVVAYHVGLPLPGGFTGVDVFFVLSGFVITDGIRRGLLREQFSFREFYVKRVRRLLPALAVVLSSVIALAAYFGPLISERSTGRTGVAAALINANHYLMRGRSYFDAAAEYNALLHTWSLSIEEQFYLVFPALIVGLWSCRVGGQRGRLVVPALAGLSLASLVVAVAWTFESRVLGWNGAQLAFYTAAARSWEFGAGALVALLVARPGLQGQTSRSSSAYLAHAATGVGALLLVLSALAISRETAFPGWAALLPVTGTSLLLAAGAAQVDRAPVQRLLRWRGLTRVGDLSYSWYLWHWPAIVFAVATFPARPLVAATLAAAGSLLLAAGTERWVENPIRFRPAAERRPTWLVAGVCVMAPIAAWLVSPTLGRPLAGDPLVADTQAAPGAYRALGCDDVNPSSVPEGGCRWGDSSSWTVVLIGDSNARHLIPGLRRVVVERGGELRAITRSSCPFMDAELRERGVASASCAAWVRRRLGELVAEPPDIAVIANSVDGYVMDPTLQLTDPGAAAPPSGPDDQIAVMSAATGRTVEALRAAGVHVVLVDPIPKFNRASATGAFDQFTGHRESAAGLRCSRVALRWWPSLCQLSRPLEDASRWWSSDVGARVHGPHEGAGVDRITLADGLCPQGICEAIDLDAAQLLYHDRGHLTVAGALRVAPLFAGFLDGWLQGGDESPVGADVGR